MDNHSIYLKQLTYKIFSTIPLSILAIL